MLAIPNLWDKKTGNKMFCQLIFFKNCQFVYFFARIFMQSASRGDRLCLVSRALFVCSPLFKPVKGQFRQIAGKGGKIFHQRGSCCCILPNLLNPVLFSWIKLQERQKSENFNPTTNPKIMSGPNKVFNIVRYPLESVLSRFSVTEELMMILEV